MENKDSQATWRGLGIGIIFSILAVLMAHYSINVVHGSYMAIDHMPVAGVFLFFILVGLLNVILLRLSKKLALSPAELLQVYIMLLVTCSITTMGLGSQILSLIAAPRYYATPENKWDTLIVSHMKPWLFIQDKGALQGFYEGVKEGAGIPWGVWLRPLLFWSPFLLSLYLLMIFIPALMAKQWVEKERLIFPLTQLPLEMAKKDNPSSLLPPFFRNRLMWFGFAIPFIISSINALHNYSPAFPELRLMNSVPIFRKTRQMIFRLSFPVLGLLYLVNLEVSFSLWFFSLIYQIAAGIFNITGIASTENLGIYGTRDVIFNHVGIGALVTFVLYGLWLARRYLKEVFLKAIGKGEIDDSEEILPYRISFWGSIITFLICLIWLILSGIPPIPAFFFLTLALIIFLGVVRVVIEGGIPTLVASGIAFPQTYSSLGTYIIGTKGLAAFYFTYIYAGDIRTFVMSAAANSMKIIREGIRKRRRMIFWSMLIAIILGIIASIVVDLKLAYRYGAINLNSWYFIGNAINPLKTIADKILHPTPPNLTGWISKLSGAAVMFFLMFMRERFIWWPLHPIGFAIGSVWLMDQLWFSVLLAWLFKFMVLRYGGPAVYLRTRPLFLGLLLGQYSAAGIWFLIDLFTGMTGNAVFWI